MSKREIIDNRKMNHEQREVESRFEETRAFDERAFQERAVMNMQYQDPLYIDPDQIPAGHEYRWMRESCLDKPDNKRMVEVRRKGWTPVPSSRHPDMVFEDFFGRFNHMKPFIYHSGLILCERPTELGVMEEKRVAEHNYKIMTSMPGTDNFMGEPSIPVRNNSQTYMSKMISGG